MNKEELSKKYILWKYYGYEGWNATGFDTLKEALEAEKYSYSQEWVITSGRIEFEVIQKSE